MIKPGQKLKLSEARSILSKASHTKMTTDIEGVFSPIGKIFIEFEMMKTEVAYTV